MTWPGLMAVTRDRGRKTRRRPETSMTKPTARGVAAHADEDDDVVDLAHRIPEGVEDGRAHEAGDEDP